MVYQLRESVAACDGHDYLGGADEEVLENVGLIIPPVQEGVCLPSIPPPPTDWLREKPPAVDATFLSSINQHVRDKSLTFEPTLHKYRIDDVPTLGSVTGLIHEFCGEFDADVAIKLMKSSSRWPRPGYLRHVMPSEVMDALSQIPQAAALLQVGFSYSAHYNIRVLGSRQTPTGISCKLHVN